MPTANRIWDFSPPILPSFFHEICGLGCGATALFFAAGATSYRVVVAVEHETEAVRLWLENEVVSKGIATFHVWPNLPDAQPAVFVRMPIAFRHAPNDCDDFSAPFISESFYASLKGGCHIGVHQVILRSVPFLRASSISASMDAPKASTSSRVRPYSRQAYSYPFSAGTWPVIVVGVGWRLVWLVEARWWRAKEFKLRVVF